VRVGDPKMDGKTGIVVLMEETNQGRRRHLQLFTPAPTNGQNR